MALKEQIHTERKCIIVFPKAASIPPDVYYQVTLKPENINGNFYRFDGTQGDECHGWKPLNSFEIVQDL